ncbi:MAG: hypothetical protein AB7F99_14530, partial [Vicinamibacterales bacterium]
ERGHYNAVDAAHCRAKALLPEVEGAHVPVESLASIPECSWIGRKGSRTGMPVVVDIGRASEPH